MALDLKELNRLHAAAVQACRDIDGSTASLASFHVIGEWSEAIRNAWPDVVAEIERLREGRLTSEEFNELCHNLHERGCPMEREEHEAACNQFRDQLFPVSFTRGERRFEAISPQVVEEGQ